jgi:hypothetical protein
MVYFEGVEEHRAQFYTCGRSLSGRLPPQGKSPRFNGKEETQMSGAHTIQIVAGALAAIVLGIIVFRRKQKAA